MLEWLIPEALNATITDLSTKPPGMVQEVCASQSFESAHHAVSHRSSPSEILAESATQRLAAAL